MKSSSLNKTTSLALPFALACAIEVTLLCLSLWPAPALADPPRAQQTVVAAAGPLSPLALPTGADVRSARAGRGAPDKAAENPPGSLLACAILPLRTADIGTPVAGVVRSVDVERGAVVRKGQVLARLRADVELAGNSVARGRANSEAEYRGAVASEDLAQQKVERSRALLRENFISAQALEQAEAELRVARERTALARDQRGIAELEAGGAAAQLSLRTLRAPFDGVITETYANPGERYEDKPLLRIVDVSRLRVDVVAPTALFGAIRLGQAIHVQPELPGVGVKMAEVVQIDKVLDPASNTFRLRLEMDNASGALPAGLRCKAGLDASVASVVAARRTRS